MQIPIPSQTPNSHSFEKATILYKKAIKPNKTVKRKKYFEVVSVLKESMRAIIITKHIFYLKMSLTIGE